MYEFVSYTYANHKHAQSHCVTFLSFSELQCKQASCRLRMNELIFHAQSHGVS